MYAINEHFSLACLYLYFFQAKFIALKRLRAILSPTLLIIYATTFLIEALNHLERHC
ncbi:hypothetical protein DB42_CZ00050 [Neochlamydia sp. EPS4]|nr:hypothetical protein DB42_CZ00050 [Neochlamydia sp. EPS4]